MSILDNVQAVLCIAMQVVVLLTSCDNIVAAATSDGMLYLIELTQVLLATCGHAVWSLLLLVMIYRALALTCSGIGSGHSLSTGDHNTNHRCAGRECRGDAVPLPAWGRRWTLSECSNKGGQYIQVLSSV